MTLVEARTKSLDVFFFGNEQARDRWCAEAEEATGRGTIMFEEFMTVGKDRFRLICAAITRRPRPVIRLIEDPSFLSD